MSNEVYAITNVEGYAEEMRIAAAQSLSDNNTDNLDDYISIGQMINLIRQECLGFDDNDRPLLDEDSNEKIYDSTMIWIHNVGLAKLASKNLIECAWDDKTNEMVFWSTNTKSSNRKRKAKPRNKKPKQP